MMKLKTLQDFENEEFNVFKPKDDIFLEVNKFNLSDVEYKVCPCCGKWFSIPRIVE